ncbi:diaminopropionate ammonia-lyase, partial [Photobacterium damselae]
MLKVSQNSYFSGQTSPLFTQEMAKETRTFHQKIEGYSPTPLVSLPNLAQLFGVKSILVKDESKRFGLNAFKVLGGSYALGQALAEHLNVDINDIDLKTVASKLEQPLVFTTATAGNHGTGVAWAAREMGQKAVVYMPKGSPQASVERIRGLGAECIVTDVNYDDTVRLANKTAEENGWMLVQDTAWEGYEQIPTWISQGYMTMADEALEQAIALAEQPTHIMLQAGVGAMAGG